MSDLPPVIYVGHHDWHHKPIDGWKPYVPADRIEALEGENARLRMILAARDAYERGEPSKPPVTGIQPKPLTPEASHD